MMITIGQDIARVCSEVTRRDFLRAGGIGLGALGLSVAELNALGSSDLGSHKAVILLMLVGGPSQLETFDPKDDAPEEIRGPFRSIATRVPGIRIVEHLPRLAARMDRFALIRSMHHDEAPIHETGQQLLQTGRLSRPDDESPTLGSVAMRLLGTRNGLPASMMVPGPITNTGVKVPHGQSSGWLGDAFEPFHLTDDPASPRFDAALAFDRARRALDRATSRSAEFGEFLGDHADHLLTKRAQTAFRLDLEPEDLRNAYGRDTFGQSCLLARRLVEAGVRLVTVNMFDTVFRKVSWDCHGSAPFSTLGDYARELLPTLDRALSTLLDDLQSRGLLGSTMVVATGEFGRTPRLNAAGGRDHWPGVWSALVGGGGVRGGQVIGTSDAHASAPASRPVTPPELFATMSRGLGLPLDRFLETPAGETYPLVEAGPIEELFH